MIAKNHGKIILFIFIIFYNFSTNAFAHYSFSFVNNLHPVATVSGGFAFTQDAGQSQTFPDTDPMINQFFIYHPDNEKTLNFYDLFLGIQLQVHPEWLFQIGLLYQVLNQFNINGNFFQGADIPSQNQFNYEYHVSSKALLAQGKLLFTQFSIEQHALYPFILFGLGAAINDASHFQTNVPAFLTFTREYRNHSQTSLSYTFGLGMDVDVLEHLRLGLGYRFLNFGMLKLGNASIDSIPVAGTLSQSHLNTNEIFLQLSFVK